MLYDDDPKEWDPCDILGLMVYPCGICLMYVFLCICFFFVEFDFLRIFIIYAAGVGLETRLPQKQCVSL